MENKNAELTSGGLKCDNVNCDWIDESVTLDDYKNWIDKPCPKCGKNVLTREDYMNVQMVIATVDILNSISPEELLENSKQVGDIKDIPFLKYLDGIENISNDDKVILTLGTHKGVTFTGIKKID